MSPFGATSRCRAVGLSVATTSAQKPGGSLRPPLSGSQLGSERDCAWLIVSADARLAARAAANPVARRFIGEIIVSSFCRARTLHCNGFFRVTQIFGLDYGCPPLRFYTGRSSDDSSNTRSQE